MKKLVKWFVKRYVTNEAVKNAVHELNAAFAEKMKVEGKKKVVDKKVVDAANDVSRCVAARLEGFADDGKIDGAELDAINTTDDAIIDKYLSDEQIAAFIDKLFAVHS